MAQYLRATLITLALALPAIASVSQAATNPIIQTGSSWKALTPTQRQLLTPFAEDWDSFPEVRKLKWIGIADRYPKMTPSEQANVRERMKEWSKLSSTERAEARAQYKKLQTASPAERKLLEQKWREYDALPSEQKQALKAAPKVGPKAAPAPSATPTYNQTVRPPKPVVVAPVSAKPARKTPPAPQQSQPAPTQTKQ